MNLYNHLKKIDYFDLYQISNNFKKSMVIRSTDIIWALEFLHFNSDKIECAISMNLYMTNI
jgi:hypothetical protein